MGNKRGAFWSKPSYQGRILRGWEVVKGYKHNWRCTVPGCFNPVKYLVDGKLVCKRHEPSYQEGLSLES